MAQQEVTKETLRTRKERLINECNSLREELQQRGSELLPAAEIAQTGVDFTLAAVGWMHVTEPYRHSKPRRRIFSIPRVIGRFLQWQVAD